MQHKTIIELEKAERYSEAGYMKLFAYDQLHCNPTIDTRTKAKYIREHNPLTYKFTQEEALYSGPTVFFDKRIDIVDYLLMKADIKSAYPSYLINDKIKKPGMYRIMIKGAAPLSDYNTLYFIKFHTNKDNLFVKWFLNSSNIQKKKINTDGRDIWGEIGIFSSNQMNLIKYVNMFLPNGAYITKSIVFVGKQAVDVEKLQIRKLYTMKENGLDTAKTELNTATGWLALIDRPTYFHMVQYIKLFLLDTAYEYGLLYDTFGVQTDCLFYRINENTKDAQRLIKNDKVSLSGEASTMGTFKFTEIRKEDILTSTARVVVKEKTNV